MKLDLKQPELSIRNEYTLQLFDEDNNLLQEIKCHNAASSKRFIEYCMLGYKVSSPTSLYLALGSGTGIINIEEAQHKLFKQIFTSSSRITFEKINTEPSFTNNHYQASITFPPTTSYVGALTEIGIVVSSSSGYCISHSLLADAAGNPIVIKKTSTNMLIVKVDMFVSVSLPSQPYNFKYFPAWASSLAGMWYSNSDMYPDTSHTWGISQSSGSDTGFPYPLIKYFYLSPYYCGEELEQENILKYPVPIMTFKTYDYNNYMYLQLAWESKELPLTTQRLNRRWDANDNNIGFAHSIVIPGFGAIALPNHEICPPYEYKNIVVGTGDGNSVTFLPYINEVVSAVGYVNGEASESNFINFDPRKSPLWNKCVKLVSNAEEYEVPGYKLENRYISGSDSQLASVSYTYCPALLSEKTHAKVTPGINSSYYIYYDEQGITLDHARIGGNTHYNNPTTYYRYDKPVTLFYSDDGEQWTQAIKIEQSYKVFYFDRVTAKYWKILFDLANVWADMKFIATFSTAEQWDKNQFTQRGMDPKFFVAGDSQEFDFGKCGITFTTPPPEGAIITMDAILDLPYKDTDIVMTMTVEVEQPNPNEVTV